MRFEFATAARIIFGPGTLAEAAEAAGTWGSRALVVTGAAQQRAEPLISLLAGRQVATTLFTVPHEPDSACINEGCALARNSGCDMVLGIGGGSAIDTAKAIAALVANSGDLLDYIEVVGRGKSLSRASLPCIAVPTTAGTGAEVTRNAVISIPGHGVKASLRSAYMLPRLAVVDPLLTHSLPPEPTASTGLDALTQCIEAFVCVKATPLADGFCREGIERAARSLKRVCSDGNDAPAREDMALASLLSGLALANAGLGAVHGFAGVIGGSCGAPHGAICAHLLPQVMMANIRSARGANAAVLDKFTCIARILTGSPTASAEEGVAWVRALCADLPLPPAATIGLTREMFGSTVAAARRASSMKGNPVELDEDELVRILENTFCRTPT